MHQQHGVGVVGGGLAGTWLAATLARQGWPVLLIEAQRLVDAVPAQRDLRTLALSVSSWVQLAALGITPAALDATPIRRIHVSYRGRPGRVLLDAADGGMDSFGHTVGYGRLLHALRAALADQERLELADGCQVEAVAGSALAARVRWRDAGGQARERLLALAVVADGGARVDGSAELGWTYRQQALACRVSSDRPCSGLAFERFTVEGPLALLPAHPDHALIWTAPPARIDALMALPDAQFLAALQDWFGDRAGRFTACTARLRYPLAARFALHSGQRRVVRIANAAQTLHPVAGQGFNLGLRDASRLAMLLGRADGRDPGAAPLLDAQRRARAGDRLLTSGITHALAETFALPLPGLAVGSALAFALLDSTPWLRRGFARLMGEGLAT